MTRLRILAPTALLMALAAPAAADYAGRDANNASVMFGAFTLSGVQISKSVPVNPATGVPIFTTASPGYVSVVNLPQTQTVVQEPSTAISVQKTSAIGTTGVLVSPTSAAARRTVTNTSSLACELMGSAGTYGAGYPLPAGESFTFDSAGRTTAALYVACASAGGTVAVLSY